MEVIVKVGEHTQIPAGTDGRFVAFCDSPPPGLTSAPRSAFGKSVEAASKEMEKEFDRVGIPRDSIRWKDVGRLS